jgi:serine protease AprX
MNRVKKLIHTNYAYSQGLCGKGINVAYLDTGIAPHPDFAGRISMFKDYCNGKASIYDDCGHGTHVAGIIAGDGRSLLDNKGMPLYGGVAPGASLFVFKVLDRRGMGSTKRMLKAADWLLQNHKKYDIRLVNISMGMVKDAGAKEQKELLLACDEMWSSGLMVVVAAGNNGPTENSVTVPGISRKILTVGSSDDDMSKSPGYTGVGPTGCCIIKPEIYAPGTNVVSCGIKGTLYSKYSGTSMAAPVVTGALAAAFQKYPDMKPQDMKLRLYERAYPRAEMIGRKGWGVIHLDNLVRS